MGFCVCGTSFLEDLTIYWYIDIYRVNTCLPFHVGDFIAPYVWEIVGRKGLTIFKGCHYSRICMMTSSSFQKSRDKIKLGPMYFKFTRTGNYITCYILVIWT